MYRCRIIHDRSHALLIVGVLILGLLRDMTTAALGGVLGLSQVRSAAYAKTKYQNLVLGLRIGRKQLNCSRSWEFDQEVSQLAGKPNRRGGGKKR